MLNSISFHIAYIIAYIKNIVQTEIYRFFTFIVTIHSYFLIKSKKVGTLAHRSGAKMPYKGMCVC